MHLKCGVLVYDYFLLAFLANTCAAIICIQLSATIFDFQCKHKNVTTDVCLFAIIALRYPFHRFERFAWEQQISCVRAQSYIIIHAQIMNSCVHKNVRTCMLIQMFAVSLQKIVNSHKYLFKNYVCRSKNWCVILAVTLQSAYSSVLSQYVPCSLQHLESQIFLVNSERLSHHTLSFIHKCLTILSGSLSLFRRCTQQKQNKNAAEPNVMLNK